MTVLANATKHWHIGQYLLRFRAIDELGTPNLEDFTFYLTVRDATTYDSTVTVKIIEEEETEKYDTEEVQDSPQTYEPPQWDPEAPSARIKKISHGG